MSEACFRRSSPEVKFVRVMEATEESRVVLNERNHACKRSESYRNGDSADGRKRMRSARAMGEAGGEHVGV
jgi:hypothetical protein